MAPSDAQHGLRRRGAASGEASSARASALAQLQSLRQEGGRRVDAFQLKLEDKIYDTLPDADYNLLVAKRRQSDRGFVVDDSGLGYDDLGEEDDWGVDARRYSSGDDEDDGDGDGDGDGKKSRKTKAKPPSGAVDDFSAFLAQFILSWFLNSITAYAFIPTSFPTTVLVFLLP